MDLSGLLKQAFSITFTTRWLWLPSFLFTLAFDLPSLLLRPFLPRPADLIDPTQYERWLLLAGEFVNNIPQLVTGLFVLSIVLGILWAIATIGQAVMIEGVAAYDADGSKSRLDYWRKGRSLLGRLVAIDAIVVFPLFLNLLLILVILGGISGSLLLTLRRGDTLTLTPLLTALSVLILPLTCLILPLSILAIIYRVIAFRFAALQNKRVGDAVRAVRPFLRSHFLNLFLLLIITALVSNGVNGLMVLFTEGVGWLSQNFVGPAGTLALDSAVLLIALGVATMRNLFVSASWTLGIQQLWAIGKG